MHRIKLFLLIFCTSLLFISCSKKEKQDEVLVKEYLEVEAVCIQNDTNKEVLFSGYLAHIYNKTQKHSFRHGIVTYKETVSKTNKDFVTPSKVTFSKIPPKLFAQSNISLSGLSYSSVNRDVFKTSCDVRVIKRLNHKPK